MNDDCANARNLLAPHLGDGVCRFQALKHCTLASVGGWRWCVGPEEVVCCFDICWPHTCVRLQGVWAVLPVGYAGCWGRCNTQLL